MKIKTLVRAAGCTPEFCFYQYRRIFQYMMAGRLYAYSSFPVDIEHHLRRQLNGP